MFDMCVALAGCLACACPPRATRSSCRTLRTVCALASGSCWRMCRRSWMRPSSPFCCSRSSSRVSDGSHPLCSLCLCVVLCMSSAMEFACCELSHVGVFFPRCIGDFFVTVSLPILHDGASAPSVVLHNVTVTHTWHYPPWATHRACASAQLYTRTRTLATEACGCMPKLRC